MIPINIQVGQYVKGKGDRSLLSYALEEGHFTNISVSFSLRSSRLSWVNINEIKYDIKV